MSYNPDITAARREAKRRARATGASYQGMLEQVANEAGASSWEAFLADPTPMPHDMATTTEAAAAVVEHGAPGRPRAAVRILAGILALAVPAACAAALADAGRMNAAAVGIAHESTTLPHVESPFDVSRPRRELPTRIEIISPRLRRLTFPITDLRVIGSTTFVKRIPAYAPFILIDPAMGGLRMREALLDGSVMRLVSVVDCTTGRMRNVRFEAARDMTSTATVVQPGAAPTRWHPAPPRTIARVCETG